jgi:hypothetical protein
MFCLIMSFKTDQEVADNTTVTDVPSGAQVVLSAYDRADTILIEEVAIASKTGTSVQGQIAAIPSGLGMRSLP